MEGALSQQVCWRSAIALVHRWYNILIASFQTYSITTVATCTLIILILSFDARSYSWLYQLLLDSPSGAFDSVHIRYCS